jgi:hypothetical protein
LVKWEVASEMNILLMKEKTQTFAWAGPLVQVGPLP